MEYNSQVVENLSISILRNDVLLFRLPFFLLIFNLKYDILIASIPPPKITDQNDEPSYFLNARMMSSKLTKNTLHSVKNKAHVYYWGANLLLSLAFSFCQSISFTDKHVFMCIDTAAINTFLL